MATRATKATLDIPAPTHEHIVQKISEAYGYIENTFGKLHALRLLFQGIAECTTDFDTTEPLATAGIAVATGIDTHIEDGLTVLRDLQVLVMGATA